MLTIRFAINRQQALSGKENIYVSYKMSFLNFSFFKGSIIKLFQGVVPEVSHHLESPSARLHPTHQNSPLAVFVSHAQKEWKRQRVWPKLVQPAQIPWQCLRGDSQQEFSPFQGQNKAGTSVLGTNFKSWLCRKNPSAYNTNRLHWFWCSPTLIPRFDLVSNTSFSLFMPS